jgi:Lrp/AsnC family transcriptional regulator, leucine-responsive regulatory protein
MCKIASLTAENRYNHCVIEPVKAPDRIDTEILRLLRENGRRTLGDIGSSVGLSAPAVKRRINRLEQAGVIRGYTVVLDHAKLGRPLEAFAELRFSGRTRVGAIEDIGAAIPEVEAVFTIAGDPDALAWLRVRDVEDLKRVIDRLRSTGQVVGTKTLMVLGTSQRTGI